MLAVMTMDQREGDEDVNSKAQEHVEIQAHERDGQPSKKYPSVKANGGVATSISVTENAYQSGGNDNAMQASHVNPEALDLNKPLAQTGELCSAAMDCSGGTPPNDVAPDSTDSTRLVHAAKPTENGAHHLKTLQKRKSTNVEDRAGSSKPLPNFELFTVEEEEGSGGYGTVYRAHCNSDGVRVAIKCPHKNAHRHHVNNEKRMLDRFGGRHFIIKCIGSFKNAESECFVLEHVEHDRPEVLKREIGISELQWYGFCMFTALDSLHRQGVIHRDVKPGNFLFSREMVKGYLIDFNLALDLRRKLGETVVRSKDPRGLKKLAGSRAAVKTGTSRGEEPGGGDGGASGITTSTRTPSADRLKEPMPCHGRKELINMVQQALHNSNREAAAAAAAAASPSLKRKRVTAVPNGSCHNNTRLDDYPTPMPFNAAVYGGSLRASASGKYDREGPCVGTKGFRSPEVLLRSGYQGPKVDVWSAGVTLLYLVTGRTPFAGDPEQNMKEIAKLRGSEEIWEVAKLHDRQASFPKELFDRQWVPTFTLKDWCLSNTKRPKFLSSVPDALFDLIDRCLTVNPRLRITARDALAHRFFLPCHHHIDKLRISTKKPRHTP